MTPVNRSALCFVPRPAPEIGVRASATLRHPQDYDLVVIGTPVWIGTMSSPVRSYLYAHRGDLPDVAFFAVMGGRGADQTLLEMKLAAGASHAPTLALTQADVDRDRHTEQCRAFARTLEARLGAAVPGAGEIPHEPVDFRPHLVAT